MRFLVCAASLGVACLPVAVEPVAQGPSGTTGVSGSGATGAPPARVILSLAQAALSVGESTVLAVQAFDAADVELPATNAVISQSGDGSASVSADRTVTAESPGQVSFVASIGDVVSAPAVLSIVPASGTASVTVFPSKLSLGIGLDYKLRGLGRDANSVPTEALTWTVSDPTILSVTPDGVIRGLAAGTATVAAAMAGVEASAAITVLASGVFHEVRLLAPAQPTNADTELFGVRVAVREIEASDSARLGSPVIPEGPIELLVDGVVATSVAAADTIETDVDTAALSEGLHALSARATVEGTAHTSDPVAFNVVHARDPSWAMIGGSPSENSVYQQSLRVDSTGLPFLTYVVDPRYATRMLASRYSGTGTSWLQMASRTWPDVTTDGEGRVTAGCEDPSADNWTAPAAFSSNSLTYFWPQNDTVGVTCATIEGGAASTCPEPCAPPSGTPGDAECVQRSDYRAVRCRNPRLDDQPGVVADGDAFYIASSEDGPPRPPGPDGAQTRPWRGDIYVRRVDGTAWDFVGGTWLDPARDLDCRRPRMTVEPARGLLLGFTCYDEGTTQWSFHLRRWAPDSSQWLSVIDGALASAENMLLGDMVTTPSGLYLRFDRPSGPLLAREVGSGIVESVSGAPPLVALARQSGGALVGLSGAYGDLRPMVSAGGDTWVGLGKILDRVVAAPATSPSLIAGPNNTLYAAWLEGEAPRVHVAKWDPAASQWVAVGGAPESNLASASHIPALALATGGNVFLSFAERVDGQLVVAGRIRIAQHAP